MGADPEYRIPIRVITEYAWHNLFARQLFIRPDWTKTGEHVPRFTIINVPRFHAVPEVDGTHSEAFVIVHLARGLVVIGGTSYAGEMKKSVFTILNYLLPLGDVLSMHCAANMGPQGDVALFFGLSGTGKTTLSVDPKRRLIGDDEHGWSRRGIFNFEGGCYAKCIRLSPENEPQIYRALGFGSVLENVTINPVTRLLDFDDDTLYRKHPGCLSPAFHRERRRSQRGRASLPHPVPDLRCVRGPAAHCSLDPGAGYVSLPIGQPPGRPTQWQLTGSEFFVII